MSCSRYEILVRDGRTEVAFKAHCLNCGVYGPDRPALKPTADLSDPDFFGTHLDALQEAILDFIDHCEGREPYRRGTDPDYPHHPEGVPWSDRDPGRQ